MHTTFLPLLLYLFFIFLCWSAKAFVAIRVRFFAKAKEIDGLAMTASYLAHVGGLLGLPWLLWQVGVHFGLFH